MKEEVKNKYAVGDLVVIKSYPVKGNMISGDPKHVPPIMVVKSIEIENKTKRIFDENTNEKIADRIKYGMIWFDSTKSEFVEKIMYESFLMKYKHEIGSNITYSFGGVVGFKTSSIELKKEKESSKDQKRSDKKDVVKIKDTVSLLSFVCPDLVMSGIKSVDNYQKFNEQGSLKFSSSQKLVKVMWFNPNQQKYSEYELPIESLVSIEN